MSMFTPEKVRELAEIVQKQGFLSSIEKEINKWLEQNPIEPVVVGLSDEQLEDLVKGLSIATTDYQFKNRLEFAREWLDAQTFAKPGVGNSDTSSNWDDAWIQELSTELAGFAYSKENIKSLITAFLDKKPNLSNGSINWQQTLQERPKPTPKVEVGQVWKHKRKGTKYEVLGFIRTYVLGEWLDYVKYEEVNGNAEFSKPQDDFLAKFEQVQP